MIKSSWLAVVLILALTGINYPVKAQTLEPRAYSNAPVGMNFLLAGYQNSSGALLFDPEIPVKDANANVNLELLGYVHTLNVAGKSAKIGVLLPYASLSADGFVDNNFVSRKTDGLADPSFYFSMSFYGAPALSLKDFKDYRQDTIVGFTFKLTAPLGKYESDKLINIGTNRWTIEPGIGVSKALGKWTLEGSAAVAFYTDNNEFSGNKTRQQEPIYSTQFHVTYSFPHKIWMAVSTTYYAGGRTTIEGISNNDLQQNWRTGLTLALPINRYHSLKLFGSKGVSARTGTNFDVLGIAWQYRWGNGY